MGVQVLASETPPDDGLVVREAGPWVKDKLGILAQYLPAFGKACKDKAPNWFYVDAFAGSGLNRIRKTGELVWGSPLIALRADPPFTRCAFLDSGTAEVQALRRRTAPYGARAVVRQGDCNTALLPLMQEAVDPRAPCLCVFDPEGPNLDWRTVASVARFKRAGFSKVEQLILFPTDTGFIRELPRERQIEGWGERDLRRVFGNDDWRAIYERRRRDEISADDARTEYVRLYADQLRHQLKYKTVLDRPVRTHGWGGRILYFLLFATDNDAGKRIMDSCFDYVPPSDQLTFGFKVARKRRIDR